MLMNMGYMSTNLIKYAVESLTASTIGIINAMQGCPEDS